MRKRIYLDGGLVSGVTGFAPREAFDIIDYDVEGAANDDDICNCNAGRQSNGTNAPHWHGKCMCNAKGEY